MIAASHLGSVCHWAAIFAPTLSTPFFLHEGNCENRGEERKEGEREREEKKKGMKLKGRKRERK